MENKNSSVSAYHNLPPKERILSEVSLSRERKMGHFNALRAEGASTVTALNVLGISRVTLFRWKRRLQNGGLLSLENYSRRPLRFRISCCDQETENLILTLRNQFPLWGRDKIAVLLKRDYNKTISASSVGKILCKAVKSGKIRPVSSFYRHKNPKPRVFNRHAQRWKNGMRATSSGELVQVDHMSVVLKNGQRIKHFEAICPVSKIIVTAAYSRATSKNAAKFLKLMKDKFKFNIKSIQVDGGSEFMNEFETACMNNKIALFVLPPRTPENNAHVERSNSTLRYEFYMQYDGPQNLLNLRGKLNEFTAFYNNFRPHQGLGYLTPSQFYEKIFHGAYNVA